MTTWFLVILLSFSTLGLPVRLVPSPGAHLNLHLVSTPDNSRHDHRKQYISLPRLSGDVILDRIRAKSPSSNKNFVRLKNTKDSAESVRYAKSFIWDLRRRRLQDIRSRPQYTRATVGRRNHMESPTASIGSFGNLVRPENARPFTATKSAEIASRAFIRTTSGYRRTSRNDVASAEDVRRSQPLWELSHHPHPRPKKQKKSSRVSSIAELPRTMPRAITSSKTVPSASTPVNFKSTRKKLEKTGELIKRISQLRLGTLPVVPKAQALKENTTGSEESAVNATSNAAQKNPLSADAKSVTNFLAQRLCPKRATRRSAANVATQESTSAASASKKSLVADTPRSTESENTSLVEKASVVAQAPLHNDNIIARSMPDKNNTVSVVDAIAIKAPMRHSQHDARVNSTGPSSMVVFITESINNEILEVRRQQNEACNETSETALAYAKVEPALQKPQDTTGATRTEALEQDADQLKPQQAQSVEGSSRESPPSWTELDEERHIALQVPKPGSHEEGLEGGTPVALQSPMPRQPSTTASLMIVSQGSSRAAIQVESTRENSVQALLSTAGSLITTTEISISNDVKTSGIFEIGLLATAPTGLTPVWAPSTSTHSHPFGQATRPEISTTLKEGFKGETVVSSVGAYASDQNTADGVARNTTNAAPTVLLKPDNAEEEDTVMSSLPRDAGITQYNWSTPSTKYEEYTVPEHVNNTTTTTPYTESYGTFRTEQKSGFVSPFLTVSEKRPYTIENTLKETLSVSVEPQMWPSIPYTAPSSMAGKGVSELLPLHRIKAAKSVTASKLENISVPSSSMQLSDGDLRRGGEATLKQAVVLDNTQKTLTNLATDYPEEQTSEYLDNRFNDTLKSTQGSVTQSALLAVTQNFVTLPEIEPAVKIRNDTRETTTGSPKGVSVLDQKHAVVDLGGVSQSNVILHNRNSLSVGLSPAITMTTLTDSPPQSNDDFGIAVTTPASSVLHNTQITTDSKTNTANKPVFSLTGATDEFESKENAASTTHQSDIQNLAAIYESTEVYSITNVLNNDVTAQSKVSTFVGTKPLITSPLNLPEEWSYTTNIAASTPTYSEGSSYYSPIPAFGGTTGHGVKLDTAPSHKESSAGSLRGSDLSTSRSSTLNVVGSEGGRAPKTACSDCTSESVFLAETSAQTPSTATPLHLNTKSGAYHTTVSGSFGEDVRDDAPSLTELHLLKSSGRRRPINSPITVHLSTRFLEHPREDAVITDKFATAATGQVTDSLTESPPDLHREMLAKGTENATTSEKYSHLKASRDTDTRIKSEAVPHETQKADNLLFLPLTTAGSTEHVNVSKPDTSTTTTLPLSAVTMHDENLGLPTPSEDVLNTARYKDKLTTPTKYATMEMLHTTNGVTVEATAPAIAATKSATRFTTMPTPGLEEKTKVPLCKSTFGLFRHPTNCNLFVHCSYSVPFIKECPANLHFNEELMVCDYPYRAGCTSAAKIN